MRRVLLPVWVVVFACAAIAGCGSSTPSSSPADPVSSELSYFPAGSPLVVSIATDPNSTEIRGLGAMMGNYPVAAFGVAYVKTRLQQLGINYDTDIHPLFGNPIVLGFADPGRPSARALVVAWVTRDASALSRLVAKTHLRKTGTHGGANLYSASGLAIAVDGPTVVAATSEQAVMAALDRHARGNGLSSGAMSQAVAGLPPHPFITAFGNLTGVLSSLRAAKARSIPWVGAIRGYALTLNASSAGLTINFKLDTSGAPLTERQLPLGAGDAPPGLVAGAPIEFGVQDPTQILGFAEQAQAATNPAAFATFLGRQAALRRRTGVDLSSLLGQLTGELAVDSNGHGTIGEVRVKDPKTAATILAKLATAPDGVLPGATLKPGSDGFYRIDERHRTINVGIVGDKLVAGNVPPSQLRRFAATALTPAPAGSHGAVAFQIALPQLVHLAVKNAPAQIQGLLSSLGNITGWIAATPQALTGAATLALR